MDSLTLKRHDSCGSSDTATQIVYVILQGYVIEESGDSIEGKSSLHIPTLAKLIMLKDV